MSIKKNDFVEIEFIAKVKDSGEVFDTNIKPEAEKAKLNIKEILPLAICVGKGMTLKGIDSFLEGKEIGENYTLNLSAEEAFGKRDSKMIKMIPLKVFLQQKIYPESGMQLALDGMVVKVLSNSGGRVLVDFNNPLAGKEVVYNLRVIKNIEEIKDKVNALQDFFFRKRFEFKVLENKKILFEVPKSAIQFVEFFAKNFEEILGEKIEVVLKEEESKEKSKNI